MNDNQCGRHDPSMGLIFDCDGTLADTMPLHFIAWSEALGKHGLAFDEDRFYSMAGQPTVKIIQTLLVEQSRTGDAQAIAIEKEMAFLNVLPQVQPIKPVVEIARRAGMQWFDVRNIHTPRRIT